MFTDNLRDPCGITILTVLPFEWNKASECAKPRPYNALSFRIIGDTEFSYAGGKVSAATGDIVFVPEETSYCVSHGKESIIAVHFRAESAVSQDIEAITPTNILCFEELFTELLKVWTAKEAGYELKAQSLFLGILSELIASRKAKKLSAGEKIAYEAAAIIRAEFRNSNLSVEKICNKVGASGTYLRRVFKKNYGISPMKYISDLRYEYARELLSSEYFSVSQAAETAGFSDSKYFAKFIKRMSGLPPSKLKASKPVNFAHGIEKL